MGVGAQRSPSSSARAVPVATFLSQRVITRVASLTDRLVDTIQQGNPGYRTTKVVPEDDLWRSCHDNLIRLLQLVGSVEARFDHVYYDAARATGRRRAEQGLPLDDVLRSFRIGGRLVWEALVAEARSLDVDDGMLDVGTRVWEVVDRSSAQVAAAYHDAVRNAVRADEQRRTAIWEGLLTGVAEDPGFAFEAARMLEVPVDALLPRRGRRALRAGLRRRTPDPGPPRRAAGPLDVAGARCIPRRARRAVRADAGARRAARRAGGARRRLVAGARARAGARRVPAGCPRAAHATPG